MYRRGVGRWFGKGELYRSRGQGSMISVYKIEPSYVTIRKYRGAPAPGAPMVPTPMYRVSCHIHCALYCSWLNGSLVPSLLDLFQCT